MQVTNIIDGNINTGRCDEEEHIDEDFYPLNLGLFWVIYVVVCPFQITIYKINFLCIEKYPVKVHLNPRISFKERYKCQGYKYILGLTCDMPEIGDTKLRQVNMNEFREEFNAPNPPPITQKVVNSGFVEATAFLVAVQFPELVLECIRHYDSQAWEIIIEDNRLVVKIQRTTFVSCLRIPKREAYLALDFTNA